MQLPVWLLLQLAVPLLSTVNTRIMRVISDVAARNQLITELNVEWYGPVWHTSTSLAAWKAYHHFFSENRYTGMLCRQFSEI